MRFPRTLALVVTGEIVLYTVLGFAAISLLLISQNLVSRIDQLTMVGLGFGDFLAVLGALLPMLASYATPVAFLFGTLLALQRMSGDGEVLAMQSCGVGLGPVLGPVLALGIAGSALCAWLIVSVEHQARREMVSVFKQTATRGGMFEPGRFRVIGERIVFVEGRDRSDRLEGVMIADYSNPARHLRIFAEGGRLVFDDETDRLRFELRNGDVHILSPDLQTGEEQRLAFDEFDYTFDIAALLGSAFLPTRPRQMTMGELRAVLARAATGDPLYGLDQRDPTEYGIEIHRRLALPIAPALFAIAAVPLGIRLTRGGRAWGAVLCAALVGCYYALHAGGAQLARVGALSAGLGLWLPNVLFGGAAAWLLARALRGAPR